MSELIIMLGFRYPSASSLTIAWQFSLPADTSAPIQATTPSYFKRLATNSRLLQPCLVRRRYLLACLQPCMRADVGDPGPGYRLQRL